MRALWYTLTIVIADQVTKVIVKTSMVRGESIPVIGDLLKWTFTENPGMAFGFELADGEPAGKLFLSIFSVLATILIFFYLRHVKEGPAGYRVSLALILGGALGNVIDRVFYAELWNYGHLFFGNVVDFIHIDVWSGILSIPFVGERYISVFPIGNIADLAIIAGVVGVLLTQKAFQTYIHELHTSTGATPEAALAMPESAIAAPEAPLAVEPHVDPTPPPVA